MSKPEENTAELFRKKYEQNSKKVIKIKRFSLKTSDMWSLQDATSLDWDQLSIIWHFPGKDER